MRIVIAGSLLLCSCAPSAEEPSGPCDPVSEACTLTHDFGAYTIAPGEERDGICMSWTLANEAELWLNGIASDNDGMVHHANWFFVPEDSYDVPDGHWDCWANGFTEQDAALIGGVIHAQSTQAATEEQRFVPGAAVRVPPRSRIIAYTHVINTGGAPYATAIRARLETIPRAAVTAPLTGFRFNYVDLRIPPQSRASFAGSCDIRSMYEPIMNRAWSFRLHWVLPHFHKLGDEFRLDLVGGERDGENIFALDGAYGEPLGRGFDPPVDLAASGADGLRFSCGYDNPGDATVRFGNGDQEMCVMLGFAESGFLFDGTVEQTSDIAPDADGVTRGTGPCRVIGVPDPG